jgi:hypothetical protein
MKWVFAILILANLGFWMWGSWYHAPPESDGPRPRQPMAAEKMNLLPRSDVALRRLPSKKTVARKSEIPSTRIKSIAQGHCYRIGPFTQLAHVDRAGVWLKSREFTYTQRREEQKTVGSYRVYLPPLSSKRAAESKRHELTRLGFRDHALIQEGDRYAISLGVYSVEANARRHLQKLKVKGVKAKIAPLAEFSEVYWLDLRDPGEAQADVDTLTILKQEDWGVARVVESACGFLEDASAVAPNTRWGP